MIVELKEVYLFYDLVSDLETFHDAKVIFEFAPNNLKSFPVLS